METKTPVTLLQELLLKKNDSPDYVLVHNGVGTHDPLFVYEVSGSGETAVGRGKSKREAKHAAAQELLYTLIRSEKKIDSVVQSPYADTLKENAVGALQDFCLMRMISFPTYEQIRDEGLPHAKIFGVKCVVSSFTTQAEARTKKQAKQNAAHLMLQKLKDCLNDEDELNSLGEQSVKRDDFKRNEDIALAKVNEYYQNEEVKMPQIKPLGTPLDDYGSLFKQDIYQASDLFNGIKGKSDSYFDELEDPESVFQELLLQLNMTWDKCPVKTVPGVSECLMCIQIKALNCASFFGIGCDEESAFRAATVSGLKWFALMGM